MDAFRMHWISFYRYFEERGKFCLEEFSVISRDFIVTIVIAKARAKRTLGFQTTLKELLKMTVKLPKIGGSGQL